MKKILIVLLVLTLTVTGCTETTVPETSNGTNNAEHVKENTDSALNQQNNETGESDSMDKDSEAGDTSASEKNSESVVSDQPETVVDNNSKVTETDTDNDTPIDTSTASTLPDHITIGQDTGFTFDEDKISAAVDMGFPSPVGELTVIDYSPSDSDAIQFNKDLTGIKLFESARHTGFKGIECHYDKRQLMWDDFFGDLDFTEYTRTLEQSLSGLNIYEKDTVDENEIYHRYYDHNEGTYYEVGELMMGNFTDENAKLTKKWTGMSCTYKGMEGLQPPTYDPLVLKDNLTQVVSASISEMNDEPVFFYDFITPDTYTQNWISIAKGIPVKTIVFDQDGLVKEIRTLTYAQEKSIEASTFIQTFDVDFTDITLFIYNAENGNVLKTLGDATIDLLPEQPFSMILSGSNGSSIEIHCGGLDDMSLDTALYLSKARDINGNTVTLRSYYKNEYVTICEEKEMVTIFGSSAMEQKFFDFERTGFVGHRTEDHKAYFTFKNLGKGSVSGFVEFYEYEIDISSDAPTFIQVNVFHKESISDDVIYGDVISYTVESFGQADESLYFFPETYTVHDYGEDSHDDGEHAPAWFQ